MILNLVCMLCTAEEESVFPELIDLSPTEEQTFATHKLKVIYNDDDDNKSLYLYYYLEKGKVEEFEELIKQGGAFNLDSFNVYLGFLNEDSCNSLPEEDFNMFEEVVECEIFEFLNITIKIVNLEGQKKEDLVKLSDVEKIDDKVDILYEFITTKSTSLDMSDIK